MSKKVVETSKVSGGKYVWEIGEVDDMGGGFGCLFLEYTSGAATSYDKDGNITNLRAHIDKVVYEGEVFDTRKDALLAGKAKLKDWEKNGFPDPNEDSWDV